MNLPPVSVSFGSIDRIDAFQSNYLPARPIDIWLPNDYDSASNYQVLYMHDGQMLFDSTHTWNQQEWGIDEAVQELIDAGKIQPTIVVGIWNGGMDRHAEYFPQKPFQALDPLIRDSLLHKATRSTEQGLFSRDIASDAYLNMLVKEVKPYIDKTYSTYTDRQHTAVCGSSMGGLISMYAMCEYPEVFGSAACLSTHWLGSFATEANPIPSAFTDYMVGHLPSPDMHRFYFDYGTETLDAHYEVHQIRIDNLVRANGYTAANYMSMKFEGDDHSEASWKRRIHIPLEFILR